MEVLDEFYYSKEFYECLNDTFLVLISKNHEVKELKDFRPISLLSIVYKIIYEVLTSRLKVVIKCLIA